MPTPTVGFRDTADGGFSDAPVMAMRTSADWQTAGGVRFVYTRPLRSCDSEDLSIEAVDTHVIFAYSAGPDLTVCPHSLVCLACRSLCCLQYHGASRGRAFINFYQVPLMLACACACTCTQADARARVCVCVCRRKRMCGWRRIRNLHWRCACPTWRCRQ